MSIIIALLVYSVEISTGPPEPTNKSGEGEMVNGFKECEDSDQSKEDIKIGEEVKPSEAKKKMGELISCFSSLNLFTRVCS